MNPYLFPLGAMIGLTAGAVAGGLTGMAVGDITENSRLGWAIFIVSVIIGGVIGLTGTAAIAWDAVHHVGAQ